MKTKAVKEDSRHGNAILRAAWLAALLLLAGCGGGGGGSTPPPPTASLSYSGSPFTFVAGTAITPVAATASQGLSGFNVTPSLPAGLSLNATNGTISGTPTAASPAQTYTVTASAGGASASTNISITVNPPPPSSASYGSSAFTFTTHIAARTLTPSAGGGSVTDWSISPALPAGLAFNTSTGAITGTPTTASAAGTYVVTAENGSGKTTLSLTIQVDSGPLLDLGHNASISVLRASGSRVLSLDAAGHWVLWDYASGTMVASGDLSCPSGCGGAHSADLAGGTLVLPTQTGFEVHSATDGTLLSTISGVFPGGWSSPDWWSLASDGSYLDAGTNTGLSVWSPSGTQELSMAGDYSKAIAFSDPSEIQIAQGPAGMNVIQTIAMPSGMSTTGPAFNGAFSSWFLDGSRFITTAGTTTMVYSQSSAQQAIITYGGTAPWVGQGNWLWTLNTSSSLEVFAIASGSTPTATFSLSGGGSPQPYGTNIWIGSGVIDLSGATPSETNYTPPSGASFPAYASFSASQWMLGSNQGVLVDGASLGGTPRYFGYGEALSIAGSGGSIAVATASGQILYFDAATLAQQGTISAQASHMALSSDGSVLAARENDGSIGIYSLPAASLLYTWTYGGGVTPNGIGLTASGALLTQVLSPPASGNIMLEATPATGGSPTFSASVVYTEPDVFTLSPEILASPDGTTFATTAGLDYTGSASSIGTNLWNGTGTLITGESGYPVGWIDSGHLLINTYTANHGGALAYGACSVYSPTGQSTGPCTLTSEVAAFQGITSDTIYAINLAEVVSVSTGNVSWMSGDTSSGAFQCGCTPGQRAGALGAVAGSRIVFVSGTKVLAQSY